MPGRTIPLRNLKVAAPCSADWNTMVGDDRVRFCGQCNLNVFNLSGMTQAEAEHVVRSAEGRLCVRFYQRADGTVLTQNCPVGLKALKARVSKIAQAAFASVLGFASGIGMHLGFGEFQSSLGRPGFHGPVMGAIPVQRMGEIEPPAIKDEPKSDERPFMGKLVCPTSRDEATKNGKKRR